MPRNEAFVKSGDNKYRHEPDNDLHTIFCALFKSIKPAAGAGEKIRGTHHHAGGAGHHNGRQFQQTVDHYCQHKPKPLPFGKKHVMKNTHPHGLLPKILKREITKDQAFAESHKRHDDVVDHDVDPHKKFVASLVNTEGVAIADIVFGFVYIAVAKHLPDEGRIVFGRKKTNCIKKEENKKTEQHDAPVFVNRQWHIVFPETEKAVTLFLPVLVNAQVNFRSK